MHPFALVNVCFASIRCGMNQLLKQRKTVSKNLTSDPCNAYETNFFTISCNDCFTYNDFWSNGEMHQNNWLINLGSVFTLFALKNHRPTTLIWMVVVSEWIRFLFLFSRWYVLVFMSLFFPCVFTLHVSWIIII